MKSTLFAVLLIALFAGQALAQVRDSAYVGPKGSGKSFKDAKIGLLNEYAKLKKTSYTVVSEKLGDDNYSVTYKFPSAEILADFQKWQYDQSAFKDKLDKFSKKSKGTGQSTDKAGRKLML